MDMEKVILTPEERKYIDELVAIARGKIADGYEIRDILTWLREKYRKDFPKKTPRDHKRPLSMNEGD
jgi:hypothetical protein